MSDSLRSGVRSRRRCNKPGVLCGGAERHISCCPIAGEAESARPLMRQRCTLKLKIDRKCIAAARRDKWQRNTKLRTKHSNCHSIDGFHHNLTDGVCQEVFSVKREIARCWATSGGLRAYCWPAFVRSLLPLLRVQRQGLASRGERCGASGAPTPCCHAVYHTGELVHSLQAIRF